MLFGKKIASECHKLSQGPEAINLPASLTFFSFIIFSGTSPGYQPPENKKQGGLLTYLKYVSVKEKVNLD